MLLNMLNDMQLEVLSKFKNIFNFYVNYYYLLPFVSVRLVYCSVIYLYTCTCILRAHLGFIRETLILGKGSSF